ncbi:glycine betaine/L-proline ABC transporter ATP-binding protein [Agrobacterium leguminum]|jgi:glycine betaine/proline transport system ATP-binding protein|uniref:Quaternary amine transport ATP-binding protein n=1 Tax=Agrobacterium leguminum TaxID=2792015 RepID=A0A9X3KFN3_9HYPH|nr:glycine betaine/L-proline ABC transporter ATP-binding protein [Agrobacterium leguminum]MCZ7910830.1 glycine betaine/L-proline ABC transporter ATP-binding protein [Agrobacterium leguminum]WLD98713.1 glycine betaine/L-proline ABC transporter ATP-binding protein [Agrobacterium leguminum]
MASQSIEIRSLYKIFGPRAADYVEPVKAGMSKADLNAKHGHVLGLRDINITMPGGQITVIMGLSGSGKSTLIRHVNRLIDPTAGEILYGGTDVCRLNEAELLEFRRHKTAMVFQKFGLLPHRNVLQNVVYGLEVQGVDKREREERAEVWIRRVGLEGFSSHYPNQLSGGMQQRVGLARALTNNAEILLMDEAYSALDPLIRVDMQTVLLELQKELKKTVVFITHDLDEALRLGDKIAILRDGEIIQQGTAAEIVMSPADSYIEAFVEEVNRGRVIRLGAIVQPEFSGQSRLQLDADMTVEEGLRALVRENVSSATVVGENGKPLGAVTTDAIMRCLVRTAHGEEAGTAERLSG